ncbi:MAG TPA: NHL repeat-containing protein [Candidatus Krumholzibacteriaceae bacterium]|nr:NHL repeat-containing protein [Candidatus Krumholzibacteriaceae bacterium]
MTGKLFFAAELAVFLLFSAVDGYTVDTAAASEDSRPAKVMPADSAGAVVELEASGNYLGKDELREPLGIFAGPRGDVYVADAMAGKVYKYDKSGNSVEFELPLFSGSVYPIDLSGSAAFIYILDYSSNRILRYDYRGAYLDILIDFAEYKNLKPVSLSVGTGGRFLMTDIENHHFTILNPMLDEELQIGAYGWDKGYFNEPMKGALLPGGRIVVADSGNRRIQLFSPSGRFLMVLGSDEEYEFCYPRSVCGDSEGNIFIADTECGEIFVFSRSGRFIMSIDSYCGNDISPSALSVSLEDKLYVADTRSSSVIIYRIVYPDSRP